MKTTRLNKLSIITHTIRASLAMVIPILFIGSMTVLINGFPVQGYQDFLDSFLAGALRNIILTIQATTVGILAIYITVALSVSYNNLTEEGQRPVFRFGSLMSCLTGFFIIAGILWDRDPSLLSGQSVFSAMVAGIVGSALFRKFESMINNRKMVFVDGADSEFNAALHVILPFLCVTTVFAAANYMITVVFDVQSIQHLFMKAMDAIFIRMHRSYSSGLLFLSLTSIMWCFGIHGNNVLHQVAEGMFGTIIPGEIVSKCFIDTFVNMGGTGCTIGLLIAMIIFGKRSSTKKLSGMAFLPGVFNINELMVFGYPIIYNPIMIIPFILSPLLCFTNAFVLTKAGFLPLVTTAVDWTTPALMSGYISTGSARGIFVQLMNILISAACYSPFVIKNEKKSLDEFSLQMDALVGILKKSEEAAEEVALTEYEGNTGRLAKHLAMDLETALTASASDITRANVENPLNLRYQPQFDNEGRCIGAEALLRWNHARYGTVYPPLVIQLARESRFLYNLDTYIIEKAVSDSADLRRRFGDDFKLSVNVTVSTLYNKKFISFLQTIADRYMLRTGNICLEITEETELVTSEATGELIKKIRSFGYLFALDDFSMGHTSLQYLQHNQFDIVKLDGSLVRSILTNDRTREIINSIIYLSGSLDFKVVAEFVETEEQRAALQESGCHIYQGYLFSPAVDKDKLISMGTTQESEEVVK